jgi:uncharacterized protein
MKLRPALLLACLIAIIPAGVALAQGFPRPVGYVNDFAQVLSPAASSDLNARLVTLEKDTSVELAVVTVDSLNGDSIENYAVGLFQAWGIGKTGKDNGILLITSMAEKKVKIEVGYGLEGIITDGRAGRILDNEVIPYFKSGDYESGITGGVIALENYVRDGTPPSLIEENPVQGLIDNFKLPEWLVWTLGVLTIYMLGFMARTKSIWLGGIWGVILGVILGFGFGKLWLILSLPVALGLFGTFLDAILSANYRGRSSGGMSTGWISSWGGFSGGAGRGW